MRNIIKNYLVWNYSAVIVLAVFMIILMIANVSRSRTLTESSTIIMIWSVIWICIVPMFVGNLAKEKRLKPKFWFTLSIIATLLPIIVAVICLIADDGDLIALVFISALLPIVSFLTFWLYCFFSGLDWSNEDEVTELSHTPYNICPQCKKTVDIDTVFCENCGNKIK